MTSRMLRLLAALLTLSLIAAACGDDDETTDAGDGVSDMADEDHDGAHDGDHDADPDDHDHDDHGAATDDAGHGHEDHGDVEFEGANPPSVDVEVTSDPAGGINVFVATENFTGAPRPPAPTMSKARGTSTSTSTVRR